MADWIPWQNRHTEPEQRIHEELTEDAAKRFAFALNDIAERSEIESAYSKFRIETGRSIDYFKTTNSGPAKESSGRLILNEDSELVNTYIELLLNELWTESDYSRENHPTEELLELDDTLRRILVEEGILLRIRPDRERLKEYAESVAGYRNSSGGGYRSRHVRSEPTPPKKDFNIEFERLANEAVVDADQHLRALGKHERWKDELRPYEEAWEQYQNQQFSYIIPEKLYNSLEAVLEKICVELEGWNTTGQGVGTYLQSIQEHGLFDPNEAMVGEWQQIVGGLKVGVQRTGGDRKRHGKIDQDYCILLLHQIAAFLIFVINRYEEGRFNN